MPEITLPIALAAGLTQGLGWRFVVSALDGDRNEGVHCFVGFTVLANTEGSASAIAEATDRGSDNVM